VLLWPLCDELFWPLTSLEVEADELGGTELLLWLCVEPAAGDEVPLCELLMSLELLEVAGGTELLLLCAPVEPVAEDPVEVPVEDEDELCELLISLELLEVVGGKELPVLLELEAGGWLLCGKVLCEEPVPFELLVPVVSLVEPLVELEAVGGRVLCDELWPVLAAPVWSDCGIAEVPLEPLQVSEMCCRFETVNVWPLELDEAAAPASLL
jgi:hypothetical protein